MAESQYIHHPKLSDYPQKLLQRRKTFGYKTISFKRTYNGYNSYTCAFVPPCRRIINFKINGGDRQCEAYFPPMILAVAGVYNKHNDTYYTPNMQAYMLCPNETDLVNPHLYQLKAVHTCIRDYSYAAAKTPKLLVLKYINYFSS